MKRELKNEMFIAHREFTNPKWKTAVMELEYIDITNAKEKAGFFLKWSCTIHCLKQSWRLSNDSHYQKKGRQKKIKVGVLSRGKIRIETCKKGSEKKLLCLFFISLNSKSFHCKNVIIKLH